MCFLAALFSALTKLYTSLDTTFGWPKRKFLSLANANHLHMVWGGGYNYYSFIFCLILPRRCCLSAQVFFTPLCLDH